MEKTPTKSMPSKATTPRKTGKQVPPGTQATPNTPHERPMPRTQIEDEAAIKPPPRSEEDAESYRIT